MSPNTLWTWPMPDAEALHALPAFARDVIAERARLAMVDPGGELHAVRPLGRVRARAIALTLADPPRAFVVVRESDGCDEVAILDRIGADRTSKQTRGVVRCPAHEDQHPSLSWRIEGSKVLLHCFRGCTFDEIRAAA